MKMPIIIKSTLLLLLVTSLLAPFTFLKPKKYGEKIEDVSSNTIVKTQQKTVTKITTQTTKKKVTKRLIKGVTNKAVEKPLHDVKLPNFGAIVDIKAKKQKFFEFLKPAVIKKNNQLLATRKKLHTWLENISLALPLSKQEQQELSLLVKKYQVNKKAPTVSKVKALLMRIDIIPMPLVLVQAANESAWGTSRFSRIGLNFFGIWCYQKGCGMIPRGRNIGENHEVAKFSSLEESVTRYYENINTNKAYQVFRTIRSELRSQEQELTPKILATGLLPYSERGVDYIVDITKMLRHNQQYLSE